MHEVLCNIFVYANILYKNFVAWRWNPMRVRVSCSSGRLAGCRLNKGYLQVEQGLPSKVKGLILFIIQFFQDFGEPKISRSDKLINKIFNFGL